jgi:hypothetical protein
MSNYFLRINGGALQRIDLEQCTAFTREQVAFSSGWLRITTTENFADALQWAIGSKVELFLGSVRIFYGTMVDPTSVAEPERQGRTYLAEDPWRAFRRTPYEQRFAMWDLASIGLGDAPMQDTAKALLFSDRSAKAQMIRVCDYLIAEQVAHPTLLPMAKGKIDAEIAMRPTKMDTTVCSEVIQRAVQWIRDAASWWDYTPTVPTFNVRRAGDMDVVTLPFGGDGSGAVQWNVQRSTENQLAYVKFVLKGQKLIGDVYLSIGETVLYPPGYTGPKQGGLSAVLMLNDDELPQANFAQTIYESSQNIGWIGSVTVQGVDIATRLRPGVVVNQSGGNAGMATMRALVLRTVDDLKMGRTTAIFTPPKVLTVQALMGQMRTLWPPSTGDERTEQQTGESPSNTYGRGDKHDPASTGGGGVPAGPSTLISP